MYYIYIVILFKKTLGTINVRFFCLYRIFEGVVPPMYLAVFENFYTRGVRAKDEDAVGFGGVGNVI